MSALGLGAAQFGMPYGVSNRHGQTPSAELGAILTVAAQAAVEVIDTAALYGSSESALGGKLPSSHAFRIVTKTPRFQSDAAASRGELREAFERSLMNLRQERIYGLLVHHAGDLLGPAGSAIWTEMEELRKEGRVEKIGVSVYAGEQVDRVVDRYLPDIVQAPVNVFDQRLVSGGHLARLQAIGVEVHVRSVFLQGLLLMDARELPPYFDPYRAHIVRYFERLADYGLDPLAAALAYVRSLNDVDIVLVGVTCAREFEDILNAHASLADLDFAEFASADEGLLDPSRWRQEAAA